MFRIAGREFIRFDKNFRRSSRPQLRCRFSFVAGSTVPVNDLNQTHLTVISNHTGKWSDGADGAALSDVRKTPLPTMLMSVDGRQ